MEKKIELQEIAVVLQNEIHQLIDFAQKAKQSPCPFSNLRSVWDDYYFRQFSRFESVFVCSVSANLDMWPGLVPVVTSHHNLHRLFEVLSLELGDRPFQETRVPERCDDLFESLNMLAEQLKAVPSLMVSSRRAGLCQDQ